MLQLLRCKLRKRLVIPAFFYVLVLSGCDVEPKKTLISFTGPTMGTSYSVKLIDEGLGHSADDIQAWVDEALERVNQSLSTYISDSELSLFNQSKTSEAHKISPSFCQVVEVNQAISAATHGRYDITIGPLVNLWGFGPEDKRGIPSEEELNAAKSKVGYQALDVDCDASTLHKSKPVYVDLSASAKGYATDVLAQLLLAKGYKRAMIEIGGELHLVGHNAADTPWRIAVEKPTLGRSGSVQIIEVKDLAVATSGDYRNYYEVDGRRISHTIDPISAAPITHKLASVTVVMREGLRADAWATAFNILGPELGYELAAQRNIAAYFIIGNDDVFTVKYTPEFEQYMVKP